MPAGRRMMGCGQHPTILIAICCLWLVNLRRFEGLDRASDEGVDRYEGTPSNNRGTALGLRVGFLLT